MRPACRPSSSSCSSVAWSDAPSSPSCTAALSAAGCTRNGPASTIARTVCASARTTSCSGSRSTVSSAIVVLLAEDRAQFVLHAARLDGAVDAALLGRVLLPPPASGSRGLSGRRRARARRAADRGVAALVQRMGRDVVRAHVVPDLLLRPLGQGVQLHDRTVVVVDLDLADICARGPLVAPQPRDPGVQGGEVPDQGLHLPDLTAQE